MDSSTNLQGLDFSITRDGDSTCQWLRARDVPPSGNIF